MAHREIRELGRGSFGRVYLAHDDQLGEVAVKELLEPDFEKERFRREITMLIEQARNPFVVNIYRYDLDAPKPYMVLEYCNGGSLDTLIGKATWQQVAMVLFHAANGLIAIHSIGGFHRDIKPANLLLTQTAAGEVIIKVADFGLARQPKTVLPPMTATPAGTPGYIAPELYQAMAQYSAPCDIYSLGIVGIELMTGSREAESLDTVNAPEGFKSLLKRMASFWAFVRPSTADVVIQLSSILNGFAPLQPAQSRALQVAQPIAAPVVVASKPADNGGFLGALLVVGGIAAAAGIAAALLADGDRPRYDRVDRQRSPGKRAKGRK